ncbi:MAG TPA: amino acid adenylation domain-containing protein [Terriglobales bacterium]|nr:amino acid adenylation domain-containing protein [Terriglobales bacterium]
MAADSINHITGLSAAKKALLRARLRKTGSEHTIPRRSKAQAPLSFAQQRLWFLDQFDPCSCAYNVARVFRLSGNLQQESLQRALNAIVDRHEVLRTTFRAIDGEPRQIINAAEPVPLHVVDLSELPGNERDARAHELIATEGTRPFNLASGPMLRATVLKLQVNEYILLLMTHHIASDGWSKGVLFQELATFYNAFLKTQRAALPELSIQYADFAAWQREWVNGERLQGELEYWKKQLEGAPALLELPTDFPRPSVPGFAGATECCIFPGELAQQLKTLSQHNGTTLFTTLLAAFQVLLSRYSRQDAIVVGTPIAGRTRPELETLIGDFVNMLAIRTSLSGDPSFREVLKRVKETSLQAYENQDLPFEMLVDEIEHGREMSRAPVFQSIFIYETAPPPAPALHDLKVEILEFDPPTAKNDLILILADHPQGLKAKLEYRTDLFTQATAKRFLRHYETLLRSIVAEPDESVSRLAILPEDERELLLDTWNQTTSPQPLDRCIHQLFEDQCQRTPDAVAVQFQDSQLSYSELNRRSNQLAHYLKRLGVGRDDRVGVCVHRSLDMIIGLLGIMKAGAAYVPLDPVYPRERLAFMLQDAGADVLLTQADLLESIAGASSRVVCIDRDWLEISREIAENPSTDSSSSDLCYVIYTSGSTGQPKGVQLEHRNVTNFLDSVHGFFGLGTSDVYLGIASMSFDASVMDFYLPLTVGAKLIITDSDKARDPHALAQLMSESAVTAMHATPSTWRSLLEGGWNGNQKLTVFSGGEALPWDLAKALLPRCSKLWNLYGPTETAVYSAIHRVSNSDGTVLVGRPIKNTPVYVLDAHSQPVPIGVPGEICIAGAGVARGYLNRPDLTDDRFVTDPFRPGQRMYRTGDLGRFRSDGIIECLGRLDHQVKIRGFRIELGEIESVLMQYARIRQAVVDVRPSQSGDRRLIAYLVAEDGALDISAVRQLLTLKLPDYMVPSVFVTVNALPLSPNGKLNRSALPDPGDTRPETAPAFVAPSSPMAAVVAEIFSQVLEVQQVGLHDNFFELGGHSLLATRVVSRLRDRFQIEVTPRLLFESPSVGSLAERISELLMQATTDDEMAAALAELGDLGTN